MSDMRLTVIMPFLNSPEIVRRQLLHFGKQNVNDFDDVEIFIMDDGSDPPLMSYPAIEEAVSTLNHARIIETNEFRPWTSSLARNMGARISNSNWLFMVDGDFIVDRKALEQARAFDGQRIGIRRELGVLLEDGTLTQDLNVLAQWGIPQQRLDKRGAKMPPHPNHFIIRKDIFWMLGGYDEKRILGSTYPQGEDRALKRLWCQARARGEVVDPDPNLRPLLYMFPNGQFCGDVDSNPFGFFHELSRKSERNPYVEGYRFGR